MKRIKYIGLILLTLTFLIGCTVAESLDGVILYTKEGKAIKLEL